MDNCASSTEYIARYGPSVPESPVVVSVPHSGRHYPPSLLAMLRLSPSRLRSLEDRYVDRLVAPLADQGFTLIVAHVARAWIDLNRSEREVDPAMVAPRPAQAALELTAKVRGGLGLVPRRLAHHGNIYHHPISRRDLVHRIEQAHRPYHALVSDMLDAARKRFGIAILLDCHSMPPLRQTASDAPAQIVIGDRNGRSSAPIFAARAAQSCHNQGMRTAINVPYAGGHILARHGKPERDVHGLQLEICRSLYLDHLQDEPNPRFETVADMVSTLAHDLSEEALSPPSSLAAE